MNEEVQKVVGLCFGYAIIAALLVILIVYLSVEVQISVEELIYYEIVNNYGISHVCGFFAFVFVMAFFVLTISKITTHKLK